MIFKREPAWWTNLAGFIIVLLATLIPNFSPVAQGWWNGVVAALVGLVIAAMTKNGLVAALVGFGKAAIVVVSGYGWLPVIHQLNDAQQAALWAVLAFISAAYVRTQVTATVGPPIVNGSVVPDGAVTVRR